MRTSVPQRIEVNSCVGFYRGRYALRVMLDLAERTDGPYTPMKDVAERQGLSLKYLARILPVLTKNGMVEGIQGKGGGYRLTQAPEDYRVGDILRLTEGDLAPVSCLEGEENQCSRCDRCGTVGFCNGLYAVVNQYIDRFTLADLVNSRKEKC